jgi:hypothetical protein
MLAYTFIFTTSSTVLPGAISIQARSVSHSINALVE